MNVLKKKTSMSEKERSKQRVESFFNEFEQRTVSFTDEEFARIERIIMERRDHAATHAVVAPIGATQPSNPRSRCSEISFDVHVCMGGITEGRMDPEPGELELSSAGTGFEAPRQQRLLNWEIERTTVDDCLLVDGNSNLRKNIFSLEELVIGTQTDSQTPTSFAS